MYKNNIIDDTIVAIASGNINQAISIIRISGPEAIQIIKKIYKGKIGKDKTITYGYIYDPLTNKTIDEVLVNFFIGSKNYVGQDTVEINAHGGIVVTNKILNLIIANGARLAQRGEFSKRAFLNGKISLDKAEAINSLIHAKTNIQAEIAIKQFNNNDNKIIESLEQQLLNIISIIEINIDYSDYNDIEQMNATKLSTLVLNLKNNIETIIKKSQNAIDVYEGIKVAIVGKPNVGKSSLLNVLLNKDRAIVTDIEGTTRDVIEADYEINGIPFKIIDTAGIRKTDNKIENIGIEKSLDSIKEAKIVVHLLNPDLEENQEDKIIKKLAKNKIYIPVINKSDLLKNKQNKNYVQISSKNKNVWELKNALVKKYLDLDYEDDNIIYNTRRLGLLKQTLNCLSAALEGLNNNYGPEVVIIDINKCWSILREILNKEYDSETLLDNMFNKFCLGK
ncbi:tRNA uridine-5-carboxymethylaminomethyl(34) synthesis GTPase MnmE [Mycoplasma enhydrae]|uniref:tRNA uridine-5-carboxymethylaminomethyl(34) synthesis GTPase MnmE n=1 Tax=Mycoplasma enhydrae TaxID=2499220 RepID=UPI00197B2947|nr:tRNA uridine-5-carboxymethylaminomethyl(34) synthesis GTPase MnmE [Mycoplasma enhydrae]MBN4089719.1 tRNA uridine-5-carboxymethylaminomethyl(34) synthesis GTPase MnmE [Mycoplasma enhydrae]MCV3753321.1 tRNA uridine-5-carboxymethylaminomethyl(34) synthesis GTPase MnmE [Mycoplasma enhydrae]